MANKSVWTSENATFNFDIDKVLADYKAELATPIKSNGKTKVGEYTQSITVRVNMQVNAQWLLVCGLWTWREYIECVYPQARQAGNN